MLGGVAFEGDDDAVRLVVQSPGQVGDPAPAFLAMALSGAVGALADGLEAADRLVADRPRSGRRAGVGLPLPRERRAAAGRLGAAAMASSAGRA